MSYIVVFVISTFFLYISEYCYKKENKIVAKLFACICILVLSVFAGFRDVSVGTDVEYYLVGHFNIAANFSGRFFDYLIYMTNVQEAEPLYVIIQYIGHQFFHSIHFVMFIISGITILFFYLGLQLKSREINIAFGWFLYCLLLFNLSLNILRQSCAITIIWYLVLAFSERKLTAVKYVLLVLLATGFHRTAFVVGPALTFLMFSFQSGKKGVSKVLALLVCLLPFSFRLISNVFMSIGGLPTKYLVYFRSMYVDQSSLMLNTLIYLLPTIVFSFLYFRKNRKEKRNLEFYLVIAIAEISCCIASNLFVSRLSYYFTVFFCFSVPYSARIVSKKNMGRIFYSAAMLFWFGIMWYINIVVFGYGQTYPYVIGRWFA